MFTTFVVLVGVVKLIFMAIGIWNSYQRHFKQVCLNLLQRYGGQGTWAIVTGASDGIGAEFCKQLAEKGFNIVLIARTPSKLEKVASELKSINEKIQTKIIVRDFCKNNNMEFFEQIKNEVLNLDIGLLIVNAGIYRPGSFVEIQSEIDENMLDANVYQVVAMVKKLMPLMTNRVGKQFGLINVSSGTGFYPQPYATTYSATKAFVNQFTLGIQMEHPLADIMLLTPGFTSTSMVRGFTGFGMADTAENCARAALRDLGQQKVTPGTLKAEIVEEFMNFGAFVLPTPIFRFLCAQTFKTHATHF